ncbi:MAG: DUF2066 domain-containing protein [Xanthomonadales bacterium]|nr:DUF2066 domain-containing protein [Xanthomonadales bacterium]NIN58308.1 DUF2066 domain-containing protein [Xanthomonadales bacterium]NIN73653.1 DUF2066 domain-containing protein [Xanthomonadales bacterium]NIO14438.1 DUF2066 domain-containing protein [Xanthomonadales bacterium]NIP10701.1 DUF2066 domain-containing protein [Xanthomonadales bacterium]
MPKLLLLLLCLVLLAGHDAAAEGLYAGEVVVSGQGVAERSRALPAALIHVLQKQTGQRELPPGPALDEVLADAGRILVSFHYRARERARPDGSVNEQLWLVAEFLPAAVDRIVRALELPRWRHERRPVTLWVVVDDGRGRRLLPEEYTYAWDAMGDVAASRGLPIAFPELSEELKDAVDLQLLWGGFTEQLLAPGADTGGVVIVAARREGPDWTLRWTYTAFDDSAGWRTHDPELSFALVEGVHALADRVAAHQSIEALSEGAWPLELAVSGFRDAGDYARILAYLEGLSLVDAVRIVAAAPGEVRFGLVLNAPPDYLKASLDSGGVLVKALSGSDYRLLR